MTKWFAIRKFSDHDTIHDQQLWYMINRLSWQWSMFIVHDQQSFIQWSTVVINDQQSFMSMINVYLTWSTVFHPMIDVDHAWTIMNDIVHKAMNNANCIYTLTFTFLLSSSPTSGERRGGMVASDHDYVTMKVIVITSNHPPLFARRRSASYWAKKWKWVYIYSLHCSWLYEQYHS